MPDFTLSCQPPWVVRTSSLPRRFASHGAINRLLLQLNLRAMVHLIKSEIEREDEGFAESVQNRPAVILP